MAFLDHAPSRKLFSFDFNAEKAVRAPIGAASPLWLAFAGATSVGLAVWMASRWLQPMEMKGFLFKPQPGKPVLEPVVEATAELVTETTAIVGTVVEAQIEAEAKIAEPFVEVTERVGEAADPPPAEIVPPVVEAAPPPEAAAAPRAKTAPIRKPKAESEAAPAPKIAAPRGTGRPTAARAMSDRRRAVKKVSAVKTPPKTKV